MADQDDLFDAKESQRLKTEGMELAAENRSEDLETYRQIALEISVRRPYLTSDDVAREAINRGLSGNLGPAAGSLFKTPDWVWTGERRRSARKSNHSREIRIYRRA